MIAVDTNVLLRLVVVDHAKQNKTAAAFFAQRSAADPAYISEMTLAEFVWVLRSAYKFDRDSLVSVLTHLLATEDLLFAKADEIRMALSNDAKGDLADWLVAQFAKSAGCEKTVTFDKHAARTVDGMELLK